MANEIIQLTAVHVVTALDDGKSYANRYGNGVIYTFDNDSI